MSHITHRDSETAARARAVADLTPDTLHQLIQTRGLDASVDIIAAATPAQLTSLLDLELWRDIQPGSDPLFDVDRFGEWLDVLVDADVSLAARTIVAADRPVVVAGLSRYIRVLDPGIFEPIEQSDDEIPDRLGGMREGDSGRHRIECELGGYIVRARRADAWDAIVALLIALDAEYGDYFHAVMQDCRRMSNSQSEVDGLDELLSAPEQHFHEVVTAREHRRTQQGYETPGDARAFLITARTKGAHRQTYISESSARLVPVDPGTPGARFPLLGRVMTPAREDELAFLANTLGAGCSVQSRPFTPQQAATAAAAICNLGLDYLSPTTLLANQGLVTAFEAGWSALHRDVGLFAADQLISLLTDLDSVDVDIRRGLVVFRRSLIRQRETGTPWLARDAAEVLAMLDVPAWIGVLGLLDECPVLPATVTAAIQGQATTVSATEFDFISSTTQIETVRAFMRKLPALLGAQEQW